MLYKPALRKKLRARRQQLHIDAIAAASKGVTSQVILLTAFIKSQTVGIYLAQENEIDTQAIMDAAILQNKQLYLPVVPPGKSKALSFYPYHPQDPLHEDRYGILEPDSKQQTACAPNALDVVFLPLVAFDRACDRIGRGAGYYDHTFSFVMTTTVKRPILIGLGYEFQQIEGTEPTKWDVPMDYIVTESMCYRRTPS